MRETIVRCDLCLKDISKEEYIPQIKIKSKPKNGWRMDSSFESTYSAHEFCIDCEKAIVDKMISLRSKGSNFKIIKEKERENDYFETVSGLTA